MKFEVISQNEWLYPDSVVATKGAKEMTLATAKNAYIGMQILLNDLTVGVTHDLSCALPLGVSFEPYLLHDVLCEKNTGPICFCVDEEAGEDATPYTTRKAPFRVYDAIEPLRELKFTATASTMALYITFFVTNDAAVGVKAFDLSISDTKIPVKLETFAVTIPQEKNLYISNWYRLDNIAVQHNVDMWSDAHWVLIDKYADLMARTRQTHFWIPNEIRDISKNADGTYMFNFDKTKRLIELFLSKGFTHIEGNLIYRRNSFWDSTFIVDIMDETVPAKSPEAYEFVSQYLKAWKAFLEENNWLDRLHQHVGDEPIEECKDEYRLLSGIVRKHLPGVPLMEAVETYDLDGAVDIWIPKNNYFNENRDKFERIRNNGEELWFYTCCYPGGHYLNRLWDMPLIRTRLLHWGNYRYGMTGYLHWGFNWCDTNRDPFNQIELFFPPGDTHISYPVGKDVWGSMRLEAMRAGIQDYELFNMLASKNKALADEICKTGLPAFDQPNENTKHFEQLRRQILETLAPKE